VSDKLQQVLEDTGTEEMSIHSVLLESRHNLVVQSSGQTTLTPSFVEMTMTSRAVDADEYETVTSLSLV
jgi:hypothetical protein